MTVHIPKRGPALLRVFLASTGHSQVDAARAVDVTAVTVHHWLHGRIAPRPERRDALAAWTSGAVPIASWDEPATSADLAMVAAIGERGEAPEVEVLHVGGVERGAA